MEHGAPGREGRPVNKALAAFNRAAQALVGLFGLQSGYCAYIRAVVLTFGLFRSPAVSEGTREGDAGAHRDGQLGRRRRRRKGKKHHHGFGRVRVLSTVLLKTKIERKLAPTTTSRWKRRVRSLCGARFHLNSNVYMWFCFRRFERERARRRGHFFLRGSAKSTGLHRIQISIIAFDETMLAAAWQRKTDTSITMQRMDENHFPDGLDMLRQNKEAELEQRRVRAAIKASKKAYDAMKIALDIEENFSSPANVRGTTPESSGDSSSESSNGDKSPRAPGKPKPKKPVGRNAASDDELIEAALIEAAIAQAQAERDGLESSGSNGGESPRAPRKEKKPKSKKELAKRAKEIRRLRVT